LPRISRIIRGVKDDLREVVFGVSDMGEKPIRVLLVEDSPTEARLIQALLTDRDAHAADPVAPPFELEWADRLSVGLERLAVGGIDVILLDLTLPDSQGWDTFTRAHAQAPQEPIILLTGLDDEELAVRAVREGAQDYLVKGQVDSSLLVRAIRYAIERKQTEEASRRSEVRFRSLIEQTTDAVFCYEYDPPIPTDLPIEEQVALFYEGVLVECNDVAARSYGATRAQEVVGRKLIDLFGTAPSSLNNFFKAFIQSGYRTVDLEGTEVLSDGTKRYYLNNGHGVVGNGMLLRVWGTFRDITERKQAEEALRESERFLQDVFDGVQDGISVLDPNLSITRVNKWIERMHHDEMPLIGKKCYEVYQKRRSPCPWCPSTKTLSTGEVHVEEVRVPYADGSFWWCELSAYPLKDDNSKIIGVIEHVKDITERKQAEEERAHSQRLLLALSQAAQAVQRARTPGEVYQTILDEMGALGYNATIFTVTDDRAHLMALHMTFEPGLLRAAEKLTGLSARNYRFPLEPGGFYQRVIAEGKTVFSDPGAGPIAEALPRPARPLAGRLEALLGVDKAIYAPLQAGGETHSLLTVMGPDLTEADVPAVTAFANQAAIAIENARLDEDLRNQMDELQRTQLQLVQSAKMAAVGELAAGVAHEINNPLTAVLGLSELLLRDAAPDDPDRQDLTDIAIQARRARDIVRGLLSFSRQAEFRRMPANVNQVVQETLALSRKRLEHGKVVVEERYAPDLPVLRLDVGRMKQVILNLITNALHAMPQGGTLTVTTEQIGSEVAVRVADTGVGIPAENLSHIFEPFFTTRPVGQGTGLGLAISQGIVQEHGGRIDVESSATESIPSEVEGRRTGQEGQGSAFTVWLPVEAL
jgi:PAS domain S-box-containing protein